MDIWFGNKERNQENEQRFRQWFLVWKKKKIRIYD